MFSQSEFPDILSTLEVNRKGKGKGSGKGKSQGDKGDGKGTGNGTTPVPAAASPGSEKGKGQWDKGTGKGTDNGTPSVQAAASPGYEKGEGQCDKGNGKGTGNGAPFAQAATSWVQCNKGKGKGAGNSTMPVPFMSSGYVVCMVPVELAPMPVSGFWTGAEQCLTPWEPGYAQPVSLQQSPQPIARSGPQTHLAGQRLIQRVEERLAESSSRPKTNRLSNKRLVNKTAAAALDSQMETVAEDMSKEDDGTRTIDQEEDDGMCTICQEQPSDSAVVPCGHMCGCFECLDIVHKSSKPDCPICRTSMTGVLKIYKS
mmetsp:Transcript_98614/g.180024  ORF Transcript_98614/g.180024 Transcript_98614/m.180024 type:complete len:314 (-) Transcript_98614:273-1214(-)